MRYRYRRSWLVHRPSRIPAPWSPLAIIAGGFTVMLFTMMILSCVAARLAGL